MLNLSQTAVAEMLGLTFQQIQKYETGTNRISASTLYSLAGHLGVPLAFFFEDIADAEPLVQSQNDVVRLLEDEEAVSLLRCFWAIERPNQRRSIVQLVRTLSRPDGES